MRLVLTLLPACAAAFLVLATASGGTFANANGVIAFTCGTNLCTVAADGTGKKTLLTGAADPSWSDDGSKIAFSTTSGIEVADSDGSNAGQLGSGLSSAQPTFSADGVRVAYARAGDLWSILANGHGQELHLTTDARTDADPQYSPDGSMLAFARDDGATGYDIWTIDLSDGTETQLTTAAGNERNPTWSPSGLTIVFDGSSNGHLFAVSSAGGTTATDLGVAGTEPAYAPDGTKIAFVDGGQVKTMVAQQNGAVTAVANTSGASQPDWQPVASPSTPPSTGGPPRNVGYPRINLATGDASPVVGHLLLASVGTWSGDFPITYTYRWKRCDPADPVNGTCVEIAGATSSSYLPTAADYQYRLRVAVTATNAQGAATQNSEVSAPVAAIAAHNTATPQITPAGSPVVDGTLSVVGGTWTGSTPIAFQYSWRRCDAVGDPATCVPIAGATASTYIPTTADIGLSLRVWITGTNPAGSDVAITNHTFPVVDKQHFAPSATQAPAIAGTALPGRQLTADAGTFTGDAPIATSFHWYRCDATGEACHAIPRAAKVVYHPTAADVGYTLRLFVFASNAYGKLLTRSEPTAAVASNPPHVRGRRIVGTKRADYIAGGGHDDTLIGLGGNDTITGGAGDDHLDGGPGNDVLTGGAGADRILGGKGSDSINAADGERDVVDCGAGADHVVADAVDILHGCESVDIVK